MKPNTILDAKKYKIKARWKEKLQSTNLLSRRKTLNKPSVPHDSSWSLKKMFGSTQPYIRGDEVEKANEP